VQAQDLQNMTKLNRKKFIKSFHRSLKTELQQSHVQSHANCCSKIIKRKVLDNSDHRTTFKKALYPCVSSFQCLKKMFFLNCSSAQCLSLQLVLGVSEEKLLLQEFFCKDSCVSVVVMRSIDHLHGLVLTVYTSAPALEHEICVFRS
jgi:hypothetical protein